MLVRVRRHHVEGKCGGLKWLKEETKAVWSQDAKGLRGPTVPTKLGTHQTRLDTPALSPRQAEDGSPR